MHIMYSSSFHILLNETAHVSSIIMMNLENRNNHFRNITVLRALRVFRPLRVLDSADQNNKQAQQSVNKVC